MTSSDEGRDVVAFLTDQHRRISSLLTAVEQSAGDERRDSFLQLRRLLAVHETAEEEIVHPRARAVLAGGDDVVGARLQEENEGKQKLARLEQLDVDSPEFETLFRELQADVLVHAQAEETHEFPGLTAQLDEQQLVGLRVAAELAERTAPTRPAPRRGKRGRQRARRTLCCDARPGARRHHRTSHRVTEAAGSLSAADLQFLLDVLDLARTGDSAALTPLLDAGVPVNLTNAAGDSLLILAAYHDHPDTVALLLERGADVERVNDNGQTALGAAVFRRSKRSVQLLLDHHADPDTGARSARAVAAFFELAEMTRLLDAASSAPSPNHHTEETSHA